MKQESKALRGVCSVLTADGPWLPWCFVDKGKGKFASVTHVISFEVT